MRMTLCVILAFLSSTAYSGMISGGGGRLHKYGQNPWYLENTKEVSYCVKVGESFSVSQERVGLIIKSAFLKWQDAFEFAEDHVHAELKPFGTVRVGTQKFVESCENPQLNFQIGTLTDEQQVYFGDVSEYIGAAVRTKYDFEHLRSEGFVYIAPLTGTLKPNAAELDSQAWVKHNHELFELVLLHEIGHLFGVSHTSNTYIYDLELMDSGLPEAAVSKRFNEAYAAGSSWATQERGPMTVVKAQTNDVYIGCGEEIFWGGHNSYRLPGNTEEPKCTKLDFSSDNVIAYESENGFYWNEIGKLHVVDINGEQQDFIKVFLPKEQKVFTSVPRHSSMMSFHGTVIGGESKQFAKSYSGKFKSSTDDRWINLTIHIAPGNVITSDAVFPDLELHSEVIWVRNY